MKNDPLDQLLSQWQPGRAVAPDFAAAVWSRVESLENAPRARPAGLWLRGFAAAACLAGGVLLAFATQPDYRAADRAAYLAGINPLTASHDR